MYQALLLCMSLALGQGPCVDQPPAQFCANNGVAQQSGCKSNEPACAVCQESSDRFLCRFIKAYGEYLPKPEPKAETPPDPCASQRRALPPPFPSPPFPTG